MMRRCLWVALVIVACLLADGIGLRFLRFRLFEDYPFAFAAFTGWMFFSQSALLAVWAVLGGKRGPWRLVAAVLALCGAVWLVTPRPGEDPGWWQPDGILFSYSSAAANSSHHGINHPEERSMRSILWILLIGLGSNPAAAGEHWPQFRGPGGDGRSDAAGLPLTWSETENVAWKTPIHDRGWSSPVIWGDQVWLTTAAADGRKMFAVCVDRGSGRVVHDVKVFDTEKPEHIAAVNSYASPTPAIESGRVYVHFGTYGTACLDTQSGGILWSRRDLNCDHHEGPGSSPILLEDLLIFHVDGRDVQYVVALDKRTGRTAWKTDRSIDYTPFTPNLRKAFCTPVVIEAGGRLEQISPGAKAVMGYDPRTGRELWKVRYFGWSVTPRPLFGHGLVFVVMDYERPELWAIRPGGEGDVTDTHVVWKLRQGVPAQPSLLLIGDLLYMVNDDGIASCIEAKSGRVVWKARMGGNYSASPIYADGRLWFFNRTATTTVLAPGRQYKVLSTNRLDGEQMATPAVSGKAIFLRTATHLYRIEQLGG
jgi:outer membrane protein assembly factor BamB